MFIYLMAGLGVRRLGVRRGEKRGSIVWEGDNEVGYKKVATIILFDCVRCCSKSVIANSNMVALVQTNFISYTTANHFLREFFS